MNGYEDYLASETSAAKLANAAALDDDPEQAARSIDLSDATGVPATAIYGDVDGFERTHRATLGSQIINDNENIVSYINSHPLAAKISHDDLGQLDNVSQSLEGIGHKSALQKWLESDSISQSFMRGYGDQPLGSSILSRPMDVEFAMSHPEVAAIGVSLATPPEFLSRAASGLISLGYDGVSQVLGEGPAKELASMAEWAMTRGDIGVKSGGGGATGPLGRMEQNAKTMQTMRDVAKGLEIADPWTKIGREPPQGLHPLIDKAKELQAREDIKGLDAAIAEAGKSATRERSPDMFANFLRGQVGDRYVRINAEAIRNLYGDKAPTPDDGLLGWVPGIADSLPAAEAAGADISVPLADYLAKGQDVHKDLHDFISLRDGVPTLDEMKIGKDTSEDSMVKLDKERDTYEQTSGDWKGPKPGASDDPTYQALTSVTGVGFNPERISDSARWGMSNNRPDIAQTALDRMQREADRDREAKPGVDANSPRYAKIEADLKLRAEQSQSSVNALSKELGLKTSGKTKVAEPKTTIPDPVSSIRASAGLEPMAMAGDRKVTLQQKMKDPNVVEPAWAKSQHTVDILDQSGNPVGTIILSEQKGGKRLYVEDIQAGTETNQFYQPNFLGPSLVRDMKSQLRQMFPNAETITGHRATGARYAGKPDDYLAPASVSLPEVKLQAGEDPQLFRDLLTPYWERSGPNSQVLRNLTLTDTERTVGQAVLDEAQRLAPNMDTEAVSRIFFPKAGGGVRGLFDPTTRKVFVSLDQGKAEGLSTLRHETVHWLRTSGLFDEREWTKLEQAAKDQDWLGKFKIDDRYAEFSPEIRAEEAIAEAFQSWKRGEELNTDTGLFQKIQDFFDAIKQRVVQALGLDKEKPWADVTWEDIFKEMDAGNVGRREIEGDGGSGEALAQTKEPPSFGLYDKGKALGVTQTHMDRMLKLIEKRNGEDLEAANRRAELRQRRRSNKDWKDRRTVLRDEVREQLQGRPDIATDLMLTKHGVKLHPAYLTEDQRARLPKDYIQQKNGINPDDIAPYMGYTSGDALVERLGMLTEDRRRAGMSQRDYLNRLIDVETDRRLNQEFGDREQNILDEAKDQALSETQLKLVHEETLAYALKAGQEPQFTHDEVKSMVKEAFGQIPIGQISSDRLLQNGLKIGKKIEEAGAKGKWDEAYRLSQQRQYSIVAAKLAREYERDRKSLDRTAKTFRKREVASVSTVYTNWVHDLLNRVGYPVNRSIQDLQENIGRQSSTDLKAFVLEKANEWNGQRDLPIADFIQDTGFRQKLDTLSHSQFRDFKSAIDMLIKAGRDEKKIYVEGAAQDLAATKQEMRDKLSTFGFKPTNAEPGPFAIFPRLAVYGLTAKETTWNRWDRNDPWGIFNRTFSYPFAQAANTKASMLLEASKLIAKIDRPKDISKLVDAPFNDPLTFDPNSPGSGGWTGFTRGHVYQMLNNAGNESNLKVMAGGYGIEPAALMQWLGRNTTKADWDRAQQLGDIFTKYVKQSGNMYERIVGAPFEKINLKPVEVTFADGTKASYPGWYHPLKRDPIRNLWTQDDAGIWHEKDVGKREDVFNSTDFYHAATANGYTKARTGAIYPLDLRYNMVPNTLRQMIHDIAFRETILESQKIFSDRRFQSDVAKYYGQEYADGLMPYIRRLAGAEGSASRNESRAGSMLEKFRQNIISTYISGNIGTIGKHMPTALVFSMNEAGVKPFLKAMFGGVDLKAYAGATRTLYGRSLDTSLPDHEFLMSTFQELQRRERNWQDTFGAQKNEFEQASNLREKMIQWGSVGVAWSDMVSAKPTALAAYDTARSEGRSHGEAVNFAERSVRRAHGSTAETNLAPAVASGGPLNRFLTSVYGFFGTAMQRRLEIAYQANDMYKLGREGELGKVATQLPSFVKNFMTYVVWPTVVEEAVRSYATKKDESWPAYLASAATGGAASSVLYARDLIHGLVTAHDPGVGLLSSASHDFAKFYRDLSHPTKSLSREHAGKTVQDTITILGDVTGMFPKVIGNAARFGLDVFNKQQHPRNPWEGIRGITQGQSERRVER